MPLGPQTPAREDDFPDDPPNTPDLDPHEQEEAEKRTTISASVVHEAVRKQGEIELRRAPSALAFSGLAAGLSMGLSLLAEALLHTHLPDQPWRPLVSKLGYTVGFVVVILARQQLFTENTLTPVIPLLTRRDGRTLAAVARLWAVVLVANLIGTAAVATAFAHLEAFAELRGGFAFLAASMEGKGFGYTVVTSVFAGWLIALLAWIEGGAREPEVAVIVILTYMVGLGGFTHVVAGSVDAAYLVAAGQRTLGHYFGAFLAPTLVGNLLGGISLVAALNHSQVMAGKKKG